MTSTEFFIIKINLSKPSNEVAVVKSTWTDDSVHFQIIQLEKYGAKYGVRHEYSGAASNESLEKIAKALEKSFEIFLAESKEAFSSEHASDNFLFELIDDEFKWFKKSPVKLSYGAAKLDSEYGICGHLLVDALNQNNRLKSAHDLKCKELDDRNRLYTDMKEANEKYVIKQKTIERENLTKFAVLLNEKKTKIKRLEETLNSLKDCSDISSFPSDTPEANNNIAMEIENGDEQFSIKLPKRAQLIQNVEKSNIPNDPEPSTSTAAHSQQSYVSDYDKDTEELCADM